MKKIVIFMAIVLLIGVFAGCSSMKDQINVVSREDGSGTRGAFIELFGIEQKNDDGTKKDLTTKDSIIATKTDIMLTNIENDKSAIGYVSLGSLNDKVKVLSIDGVQANAENVKNGTYQICRPFIIAIKDNVAGITKDFIDFILSEEGQEVVSQGYIAIDDNAPMYEGNMPGGKITIAGSSSVTPIMEKLKEAYLAKNPAVQIEIQMSDSTPGITGAIDGTCEIGMASRDLKESEKEKLVSIEIALDGIAVIVNSENILSELTKEQVKEIYTGNIINWSELSK